MRWWLLPYKWKQQWARQTEASHAEEEEARGFWLIGKIKKRFAKEKPSYWTVDLKTRAPASNYIYTSNYTVLSFVPKFLFLQFKQFANALFLALCIIQCFPDLSPFGIQATAGPLIFIICCSAVREIYEEIRRRIRDRRVNHQKVWAHTEQGWQLVKWCRLHVGQAVKVEDGRELPADVLFISSSETGDVGYIETANLDGENSIKVRQALTQTAAFKTDDAVESLWKMGGQIVCDRPNKDIHKFLGYFDVPNLGKLPITNANMLYRGARLKNTDYIYGITVYTGKDTKLKMNNTKRSLKRAKLSRMTNSVMLAQFGIACLIALIAAVCQRSCPEQNFLAFVFGETKLYSLHFIFLGCLLLFMGLVPISLYVTLEMIQVAQGFFIRGDREMYDEKKNLSADVKTFSLNSELGEVRYVMSDKTGTLTQNCMRFRQCSLGGRKYANKRKKSQAVFNPTRLLTDAASDKYGNAKCIREFLLSCAICHTVNTDKHSLDQDRPLYHATSPDEAALVGFAADAGYIFHSRQHHKGTITLKIGEKLEKFDLLHVFEFTSNRKRMSVVVRTEDGGIRLYVKGADHVLLPRLADIKPKILKKTKTHLHNFATAGYRTLCFAVRSVTEEEWRAVLPRLQAAKVDLLNQQALFSNIAFNMETNLELIGISAIEDRLQDEVPKTIERMISSGMHVWILTGDKLETAVNIGNSCRLLDPKTPMFVLKNQNEEEIRSKLLEMVEELNDKLDQDRLRLALIVDAASLDIILADDVLRLQFLRLALCCSAVICCRCTPLQKAAVTRLVKRNADGCVLAIGDGANDVAMIQEADVGVGIAGEEGMQAALAADYSIAQFRFLDQLLFVHGTLSLYRTSKCILYSIYKNVFETTCLFLFTFYSGRSDQPMADQWTIVRYNIIFTSWPAIIMGTLDRPAGVDFFKKYSQMYQLYQNLLNMGGQMSWFGMGLGHGLAIFVIMIGSWGRGAPLAQNHGRDDHLYLYGVLMYILIVTVANVKAVLETSSVTVVCVFAAVGSVVSLFLCLYLDSWIYVGSSTQMTDMFSHQPWPMTFFMIFLGLVATMLPDITFKTIRHSIYKDARDEILWREGVRGPNFERLYNPLHKIVDTIGSRHFTTGLNSGFAFSQDDGEAITQSQLISGFVKRDDVEDDVISSRQGVTLRSSREQLSSQKEVVRSRE